MAKICQTISTNDDNYIWQKWWNKKWINEIQMNNKVGSHSVIWGPVKAQSLWLTSEHI